MLKNERKKCVFWLIKHSKNHNFFYRSHSTAHVSYAYVCTTHVFNLPLINVCVQTQQLKSINCSKKSHFYRQQIDYKPTQQITMSSWCVAVMKTDLKFLSVMLFVTKIFFLKATNKQNDWKASFKYPTVLHAWFVKYFKADNKKWQKPINWLPLSFNLLL